jgi:hypothetical protein
VPHRPLDADIYDIKQYTRDPRNQPNDDWVQYNTKELSAGRLEEKPLKLGSKGSKVPTMRPCSRANAMRVVRGRDMGFLFCGAEPCGHGV